VLVSCKPPWGVPGICHVNPKLDSADGLLAPQLTDHRVLVKQELRNHHATQSPAYSVGLLRCVPSNVSDPARVKRRYWIEEQVARLDQDFGRELSNTKEPAASPKCDFSCVAR
jgi:hypothetical protein